MAVTNRRFDIDWLRVLAIGLLLIYHIAIAFQPWGVFIGFIQNNESMEWIWIPMSMLNVWRIPLLFFVSGMGVYFAIQRRDWKALLLERSQRILLPFLFGICTIVPLHVWIWQDYYHQDLQYAPNPAHLWFLGNIFVYVLLCSPLFFYLKTRRAGKVKEVLQRLLSNPMGTIVLMVPFIAEAELLKPENFELYAMTWHGFWLGLLAFFVGFLCVYSGSTFWDTLTQWRWLFFGLSVSLYLVRLLAFELKSPDFLMAIESNLWIFTVFGFGHKYLNQPSPPLAYLSQAAYPVYILHMIFLYLGSMLFFPLDLPAFTKFLMLVVFTGMGCFVVYEFGIRRVKYLRPLFGLKL